MLWEMLRLMRLPPLLVGTEEWCGVKDAVVEQCVAVAVRAEWCGVVSSGVKAGVAACGGGWGASVKCG